MESDPAQTVQVDFSLQTSQGAMKVSVGVPAGPVTLTGLLPVLQSMTSHMVDGVNTRLIEETGQGISCRAGCAACCRQLVPISIFEAEALGEWVRSLPVEQQAQLEERFHQALLALAAAGMTEKLRPATWEDGSDVAGTSTTDYFRAGVPCPFLVEESCGIYPIRPLVCREYVVVSPPQHCATVWDGQVTGVQMPMQMSMALRRIGGWVENDPRGWMPLVFLFLWMQQRASPGNAVAGSGPEVLKRVLEAL